MVLIIYMISHANKSEMRPDMRLSQTWKRATTLTFLSLYFVVDEAELGAHKSPSRAHKGPRAPQTAQGGPAGAQGEPTRPEGGPQGPKGSPEGPKGPANSKGKNSWVCLRFVFEEVPFQASAWP